MRGNEEVNRPNMENGIAANARVTARRLFPDSPMMQANWPDLLAHTLRTWGIESSDDEPLRTPPVCEYVLDVFNGIEPLHKVFQNAARLVCAMDAPPPGEWLESVGWTEVSFIQDCLNSGTVMLHSCMDRTLIASSAVLQLDMEPRQCSYKSMKQRLGPNDGAIRDALGELALATAELSDARHQFVHRGVNRKTEDLLRTHILVALDPVLRFPETLIGDNLAAAKLSAIRAFGTDLVAMSKGVRKVEEALVPHYNSRIAALGGINQLSMQESRRFLLWFEEHEGGGR